MPGSMNRGVLVLNAGSSSLKYALYHLGEQTRCAISGLVERIGTSKSTLTHNLFKTVGETAEKETSTRREPLADHKEALAAVVAELRGSGTDPRSVVGVGHRVVHGGEALTAPALVTPAVKRAIEAATHLAPLHNPANLQGISVAEELFPCPQVAVFDTAFHATIPPHAYIYALPYRLYENLKVRRYGFHGTSYTYLLARTAAMLGKEVEDVNAIFCHLGAGASMAVVKSGRCLDTSMGVTPLEGLVMATRSGDVDPALGKLLADEKGLSPTEVDAMLNKESGLLGICGEKDMKAVVERAEAGDERALLALRVFVHRVRKYLGAYLLQLGGRADALVFSAGIGERSAPVRELVCEGLEGFGIALDTTRNSDVGKSETDVSASTSNTRILVIPTDEELCIAQQTLQVIQVQSH